MCCQPRGSTASGDEDVAGGGLAVGAEEQGRYGPREQVEVGHGDSARMRGVTVAAALTRLRLRTLTRE